VKVTVVAPAKVNLWLRVGDLEPSGYHHIDTLFCTLRLSDTVEVRLETGLRRVKLETGAAPPLDTVPDLGPARKNLAVRAARAFVKRGGVKGRVEIQLVKRIPAAAGLGGGSSDAAAVIRALHRLSPGTLSSEDLESLARDLGSDVPFFVHGHPLARGTDRGETLEPLTPLPSRPVVLAIPPVPVPTADAYRWLDEERGTGSIGTAANGGDVTGPLDWETVDQLAGNDFESAVFGRYPELARTRDLLREHGATTALLAGSGSTVFGVFEEQGTAERAASILDEGGTGLLTVTTATRVR
jgi:4-diphosphocytidyl-2-C-methyl-D-erythritol kinase